MPAGQAKNSGNTEILAVEDVTNLKISDMKNEQKHTPGHWVYHILDNQLPVVFTDDEDGITICQLYDENTRMGENAENNEANAKLIAAAPELLEALKDVLNHLEWDDSESPAQKAYDKAIEAIKKATE